MLSLVVGLQVVHNGTPVELLYLRWKGKTAECWEVKPLYVLGPSYQEVIYHEDTLSRLHTQTTHA